MLADRRRLCAIGFVINLQLRSEAHTSWEFSRTFRAVAWLKRICGGGPTESLFFFLPALLFSSRRAGAKSAPLFFATMPRFPLRLAHRPRTRTASNLRVGHSSSFRLRGQRLWRLPCCARLLSETLSRKVMVYSISVIVSGLSACGGALYAL